jgi:hypothetical protein
MELKRSTEFDENIREEISTIFVNTYIHKLRFFSKDTNSLIKAFIHIFVLENLYVAINNNEIVGIIGYMDKEHFSIKYKSEILIKHFGIVKGILAKNVLKECFDNIRKYHIKTSNDTAVIEFFTLTEKYRKIGYLLEMTRQFFLIFKDKNFIVEVPNIKKDVIKMYEQIGFKVIVGEEHKFSKYIGINNMVYMEKTGGGG